MIAKEDVGNHEDMWLIGGGIAQEDEVKHGDIVAHWRWGSSKRCSESWRYFGSSEVGCLK